MSHAGMKSWPAHDHVFDNLPITLSSGMFGMARATNSHSQDDLSCTAGRGARAAGTHCAPDLPKRASPEMAAGRSTTFHFQGWSHAASHSEAWTWAAD